MVMCVHAVNKNPRVFHEALHRLPRLHSYESRSERLVRDDTTCLVRIIRAKRENLRGKRKAVTEEINLAS